MSLISKRKNAIFRVFLVFTALFLASCGGGDGFAPVQHTDVTRVLFRPFAKGEYVFRTQADLQNALSVAPFTSKYPVGISEEPIVPNYDFESSMIVGLSDGLGRYCFIPKITQVFVDDGSVLVQYTIPTGSTMACLFDAPAIVFALIPKTAGKVEWQRVVAN